MCVYSLDCLSRGEKPKSGERLVIALGNFDGIHKGHAALLEKTVSLAGELSAAAAVWMFVPHPSFCLTGKPLPLITTFDERREMFAECGIQYSVNADFSSFRSMKKEDFLRFLRDELCVVGAVCGYNYSFGERGSGRCEDVLRFFGENAAVLPEMKHEDMHISSTEIRRLISEGDVLTASALLGRPYFVKGTVEHGREIGRKISFPTANITLPKDKIEPSVGIYATETLVDGKRYPSVSNYGSNPTVTEESRKKLETHIIGFDGDIYGRELRVEFIKKIRDEKKFASLEELSSQIARDMQAAEELYRIRGERRNEE